MYFFISLVNRQHNIDGFIVMVVHIDDLLSNPEQKKE